MTKPFFIIFGTHGRCGTKWLADCLQPAVHMSPRGEIWQPHQIEEARRLWSPHHFSEPVAYLRWWCRRQGPECRGAKAFPSLVPRPFDEHLVTNVDRVIFVYRRNLTEQMVSLAVASKAGWSKHRQRDPERQFEVNIDMAISNAEWAVAAWRRCIAACKPERRRIVAYEDIALGTGYMQFAGSIESLRAFVGLPQLPPDFSSRFQVQRSPERYQRLISNYDEIQERMGERYGLLFGPPGSFSQVEEL